MRRFAIVGSCLALATTGLKLDAQVLASERSSVSQTVDGTTATLTYYRPRARGRTGLFGSRVRWGEVWTPGANQATTLNVNKDVSIEGQPVAKGTYSIWFVIARGPWEMVLDKDTTLFHTQGPKQRPGQIRFPISREKRPFMETLTWSFPEVSTAGATLALQWDTVYVPVRLRVTPSYNTAVDATTARHIAGSYHIHFEPEPSSSDTTLAAPLETGASDVTFTVRQQGSELRGIMAPPMYRTEDGYADWILLPTKGSWFTMGRIHKGELIEILDFFQMQFDSAGTVANGFEIRAPNDQLIGRGTRRADR